MTQTMHRLLEKYLVDRDGSEHEMLPCPYCGSKMTWAHEFPMDRPCARPVCSSNGDCFMRFNQTNFGSNVRRAVASVNKRPSKGA